MMPIKIIIGLGNPGAKYARTYHNAGFMAVDALHEGLAGSKAKKAPLFEHARAGDYILVKPRTFMNESGGAVAAALRFFKTKPEELLVIHDDSDLPFGTARAAFGSGSAGHHGVESIIAALGTKEFHRIRIGVRKKTAAKADLPAAAPAKASEFVLKRMTAADERALQSFFGGIIEKLTTNERPDPSGLISENGKFTP